MWIDSGIHAREWISPATGTWMLSELVENDDKHPELTEGLDWSEQLASCLAASRLVASHLVTSHVVAFHEFAPHEVASHLVACALVASPCRYFLPSHNPDGYRKSREDDRMWRKTTTQYSGDGCQGTDANRWRVIHTCANWRLQFDLLDTVSLQLVYLPG